MKHALRSLKLLTFDLGSTFLFLGVMLATHNLKLAIALGVVLGSLQIIWLLVRGRTIDPMQWISIGMVVVAGLASLITDDPRFVMIKPTVIYCLVGVYMLRPGWLNRYLPPQTIELVPDIAYVFGFAWAGLMFVSAALNLTLALALDPVSWATTMSAWGIASKTVLFCLQFVLMRLIAGRRGHAREPGIPSTAAR